MFGTATQNLGTLVVDLTARTVNYEKGMQSIIRSTKSSMSKSLSIIAQTAKVAAAALAAVATATIAAWAQVDEALTKSTSIMGDVSYKLRKEMEMTAREMATNTVTSAKALADSYYFLASAGLTAEQSIAALGTVEKFSVAGAFDMAKATDLLTDAQTALGLASKDAAENMENMTRVSDVLSKASTMANASIEQFSESLTNKAATRLAAFNKDVEEGVAVLARYADAGVKGRIAGERLNILFRELDRVSRANAKNWEAIGVAIYDTEGNMRNIADVVADLEVALGGMTAKQRAAAIATLGFGSEAQDALIPLIGASDVLKLYEQRLRDAGGTTERVAQKQLMSFNAQMKILWNRITEFAMVVGEHMAPAVMALNNMFKEGYEETDGFKDSITTLGEYLGATFLSVVGMVGDSIQGWKIIFKSVEVAWLTTVSAFKTQIELVKLDFDIISSFIKDAMNDWTLIPLGLKLMMLEAVQAIMNGVERALGPTVKLINLVNEQIAKLSGRVHVPIEFEFPGQESVLKEIEETQKQLADAGSEEFKAALARKEAYLREWGHKATKHQQDATEAHLELLEMIGETKFSDKLKEAYMKVLEVIHGQTEVTKDSIDEVNTEIAKTGDLLDENEEKANKFAETLSEGLGRAIRTGEDLVDVLKDAALQMASEAFQNLIFPTGNTGNGSTGGDGLGKVIGGIGKFIGSMFGGGRASGGPVMPHTVYEVNEKEPEFLKMNGSGGEVIPLSKMPMGTGSPIYNISIHAPMADTSAIQALQRALPAMIEQGSLASIAKAQNQRRI